MSKAQRTAMGDYWAKTIEKEAALRSMWFRKNEARLNENANKLISSRAVPEEVKEKIKKNRIEAFQQIKKFPRIKTEDTVIDFEGNLQDIMRPVNPEITKLIYTGHNKDGRENYLRERVKLIPEKRFYFPECTSWDHGWKQWHRMKDNRTLGFGRQQIIKASFYRRRGVERDPEWYKEPAHINPTFCNMCR
ncbi:unnamed protein product [Ceutorhynchus assimilis]|uniref:Sperm microtubule inner protein 1 C-terminal domain-containing protein n=1 Tax=Ceutorhynchus assimilis TaxID=467358 RepID=A0A9N9MXN9_9CUCU|nr:unnamed protein product [Ceutorhynchus assimilis]